MFCIARLYLGSPELARDLLYQASTYKPEQNATQKSDESTGFVFEGVLTLSSARRASHLEAQLGNMS